MTLHRPQGRNASQNGPFQPVKRAIREHKTGRSVMQNDPFYKYL